MRAIRKPFVVVVLGGVIGALMFWWWGTHGSQSPHVPALPVAVRMALLNIPAAAPVWLAITQGFFLQAGLEVVVQEYETGAAALAALQRGESDVATAADAPIVLQLQQPDFAVVTTLVTSDRFAEMLTRTDTGIQRIADARGKKIGLAQGSTSSFLLESALLRDGLAPTEVEVIDAPPERLPALLRDRAVDVVVAWEPYLSDIEQMLAGQVRVLPPSDLYRATFDLVVRNAFATQHPEAMRRVVQALDAAIGFMHQHPVEARQMTFMRIRPHVTLSETRWRAYQFALKLDQPLLLTMEDIARWAIRTRLADGTPMPNFLRAFYVDALASVRPDAVTLIR